MKLLKLLIIGFLLTACNTMPFVGINSDSASDSQPAQIPETPPGYELATFAGGCFWCIESGFESLPGVHAVTSGFAGGEEIDPTYEDVAYGRTGHAETVQVIYDPTQSSYNDLLDLFFRWIDPTDADGQYVDRGPEYRTIVFYHNEEHKKLAEEKIAQLEESGRYDQPIVTTIEPYTTFYPAPEYHQDFYKKAPERYKSYKEGSGRPKDL